MSTGIGMGWDSHVKIAMGMSGIGCFCEFCNIRQYFGILKMGMKIYFSGLGHLCLRKSSRYNLYFLEYVF